MFATPPKTMESTSTVLAQSLQIAGWLLTVLGQVQIGLKVRQGFLTWIAANAVLIALSGAVGLWWSIGMYVTNVAVCVWSYRRWTSDAQPLQPLGTGRAARWSRASWN
jgi:membrane protein implicated in regulation of membrane protease activity